MTAAVADAWRFPFVSRSDADVKPTNPEVQSNDAQVEDENSTFDENDDKKACYEARLESVDRVDIDHVEICWNHA